MPTKPVSEEDDVHEFVEVGHGKIHCCDFWGDMGKYSDDDFDPIVSRLNVPQRVDFMKLISSKFENPVGTFVIQNTSNLPMTFYIVSLSKVTVPNQITPSPDMGWIAPQSLAHVEIRISEKASKSFGRIPAEYTGCFVVYGAPVFRHEHAQPANLEMFWKGFGTNLFPCSHAEAHSSFFRVSTMKFEDSDLNGFSHSGNYDFDVDPPYWIKNLKQASAEEFGSLWTPGDDADEYKFCLEFRLKEYQRAVKRRQIPYDRPFIHSLTMMIIMIILFVAAILAFIYEKDPKEEDSFDQPGATVSAQTLN